MLLWVLAAPPHLWGWGGVLGTLAQLLAQMSLVQTISPEGGTVVIVQMLVQTLVQVISA